MVETQREICVSLHFLIKPPVLLDKVLILKTPFNLKHLFKALPPNTVTLGLGLQRINWGEANQSIPHPGETKAARIPAKPSAGRLSPSLTL